MAANLISTNNDHQMFQIFQWNCRSIMGKKEELVSLINPIDYDCLLISESWLSSNDKFGLKNYKSFRCDRQNRPGGGVLLLIKEKYNPVIHKIMSNNSLIEVVACKIYLNKTAVILGSIYIPKNTNIEAGDFKLLLDQFGNNFILGGDFNAHHTCWGCAYVKPRGDSLLDALDDVGAIFLNDGSATRIALPPVESSAVDLTICSSNFGLNTSWATLSSPGSSDHLPIHVSIHLTNSVTNKPNKLRGLSWKKFQKTVTDLFDKTVYVGTPAYKYKLFMNTINEAIELSKSVTNQIKPFNYWWDSQCDDMVRQRREKFIAFRSLNSKKAFLEYKHIAAITKKFLKTKKKRFVE